MRNEQTVIHLSTPVSQSTFKGITRPVLISAAFFMVVTGIFLRLIRMNASNCTGTRVWCRRSFAIGTSRDT